MDGGFFHAGNDFISNSRSVFAFNLRSPILASLESPA
jgi:hypothetical protein